MINNEAMQIRPRLMSRITAFALVLVCTMCIGLMNIENGQSYVRAVKSRRQVLNTVIEPKDSEIGGAAIAILVPAFDADVANCCIALKSLKFLKGDQDYLPKDKAPVLLFNEGFLTLNQMNFLSGCTDRTVAFPVVNMEKQFPVGFGDVKEEWKKFLDEYDIAGLGRPPHFSYANMIAFWTRWIWEHPAVQQFDTIMRIDTDSCFLDSIGDNPNFNRLPYLDNQYVYQSVAPENGMARHYYDKDTLKWNGKQHRPNIADIGTNSDCHRRNKQDYVVGLYDYAMDYIRRENIVPTNQGIWGAAKSGWEQFCSLHTFQTNFEVVRRDFFQSKKVLRWHRALAGAEPFGTYRQRWGDAQTRFLTMAIFAPEGSVLSVAVDGYAHGKDYNGKGHPYKCKLASNKGMFD